jgi:hypothetical protein
MASPEYSDAADSRQPIDLRDEYERAIAEIREKEKELSKRTEMLEGMMRALSCILPTPPSSTPVEAPTGTYPPSFNFQTSSPREQYPSVNLTTGIANPHVLPSYSKAYLRDALELVPKYDGHCIPVWQFARACKRARESVPLVDEALFVRMLRNKLTHHAYLAVEDEIHPTVERFLDTLKQTFGPGRSSNYYRGQLSMAYKKPHEHILDYIGRIKDLKTAIMEGDQTNLGRQLTESELAAIENFTLEAFYEGLPREYRIELRAEGYNNFSDACSKTLMINRRLEREEARYRYVRPPRDNPTTARAPQPNSPTSSDNPPKATEIGGNKICAYCKSIGHLISECRKRQYRENLDNRGYQRNSNAINATRATGNREEASANGTLRGPGNPRPAYCIEGTSGLSMSSEEIAERSPQSNSNLRPSEHQRPSCSTQEHSLTLLN